MSDILSHPHTKAGRVQRVVLDLLHEHEADGALPTNGRFVFYELEQRGDARKPAHNDARPNKRRSHGWPPGAQDVTDALTVLRERGIVPWDWIVDEGRDLSEWRTAASVREYLLDALDEAVIDPWDDDDSAPLVLCESRATAGVLERVASEYSVSIAGTGGHTAGFLRTVVAPSIEDDQRVLWLGDLDFSGGHIEASVRGTLEDQLGRGLSWERLAMTAEQAAEHGITPIWKTDGRTRQAHEAIEVESLGQARLVELVRSTLDALLPEPLDRVQERADAQRKRLRRLLEAEDAGE